MHDLVLILFSVICRSDEFAALALRSVHKLLKRMLRIIAILSVDVTEEHVSIGSSIDHSERSASIFSSERLSLTCLDLLKGICDEKLLKNL